MFEHRAPRESKTREEGDQRIRFIAGARLTRVAQLIASAAALLLLLVAPARAQEPTNRITGQVTAAGTGEPLVDVQVTVEGTSISALTDAEGRYVLTAPSTTGTLVFARLGYGGQQAVFDGQEVVNMELSVSATELDEIVVVGYGEKRRVTMTESIGTVTAEEIQRVPIASPEVAIQGRVSGIQIQAESGVPGAPVAVRMRGVGTVGNTQPLYVIDGVPVGRGDNPTSSPLTTINPADIEQISVLKDASAAAMYGVQAANGVVLIETRRGSFGKPTIRYDAYMGVQSFAKRYEVLSSQQWFDLARESNANTNAQFEYTPGDGNYLQLPEYLVENEAQLVNRNTDWQDVIEVENAPIMNHNLSISGATDRVNYYVSAGYFRQRPIVERWDLDRLNFRANSDFQVTDRIRIGESFSISGQQVFRGQQNNFNGQLMPNALSLPPFFRFRDENNEIPGNRYGFNGNAEFIPAGLTMGNEPALNLMKEETDRRIQVLGGLFGEVDVLPGLTIRSQGNVDFRTTRDTRWYPPHSVEEVGLQREDTNVEQRTDYWGLVWTNTATYSGLFGAHAIDVLGGLEVQRYKDTGTQIELTHFLSTDPAFRDVVAAGSDLLGPPSGWAGERGFLSFLGRIGYNYDDRYLATLSLRRDGASTFAPENRWGTFPAVSLGWRPSEESFFNVPWISELKLRGSWGQMGNSDIPGAQYTHVFQITPTPNYGLNGEDVVITPVPDGWVNPNLTWETSEMIDFGFESGLFDNAVSLAATYYRRDTKDFLVNVPLPWVSGYPGGSPVNSGSVRNTGFEFEAGYRTTLAAGVDLSFSGNLTTVENEMVSLREGISEYAEGDGYRTAVGYPLGYFYGFKTCGIYQTQEAAEAAPPDLTIGSNRPMAGDLCFQDVNGDGQISPDDRTYLGKTIPDFFYGLTLNASYRRFDVNVFFSGVGGVQKYNAVRQDLEAVSGGGSNRSTAVLDRWTPENSSNTMPRATADDTNDNDRYSDRWIEDADYFRLRNVQVGYTLPEGLFGMSRTRVYVSGTNLFTLTPYKGLDPEFTTSVDFVRSENDVQTEAGTDWGNLPQPRTFQIGVSTSF